ncbi:MAG: hypothetical protein GY803_04460 [Chloroflexi bacterium]|nr:hypothetical protein [Chloroflexota bacterium]
MNDRTLVLTSGLRQKRHWLLRLSVAVVLLVSILALSRSVAQTATAITIEVREYVPGGAPGAGPLITPFTYLVNENNAGDPSNPSNLPSLTPMASYSSIVALGDNTTAAFSLPDVNDPGSDGRYLISVRADGYKLGGKHIQLPDDNGSVVIELVPEPLPLTQLKIHVFHDNQPVNGEDDSAGIVGSDLEPGLEGFRLVFGDTAGETTVDWYGNPLCTEYDGVGTSTPLGDPIPGTGGICITDANGDIFVENIPRGKYEVVMTPPPGEESDWVQTTTIEGTHVIDAWLVEGDTGVSPREGFGQAAAAVWVGFVKACEFGDTSDTCSTNDVAGLGTITGDVKTIIEWTPPVSPIQLGQPMYKPVVSMTDIGATDRQVYMGRGDEQGAFTITGIPDGTYQVGIWDEPLDYIIGFRTVIVPEDPASPCNVDNDPYTIDMNSLVVTDPQTGAQSCDHQGGVGVARWFGWTSGYVFLDDGYESDGVTYHADWVGNGIRDCADINAAMGQPDSPYGGGDWSSCERSMDGEEVVTRFRDGTVQYGTFSDNDGFYEFPEVKELEKFSVVEVGFGRYGRTGASMHHEITPTLAISFEPGALTVQTLPWAAKRSWIDWGKHNYDLAAGENGGISGIVYNAITRNEIDIRFAAAEGYEPGIPGVTVRLYDATDDTLLNETQTDAWEHPSGCDVTDYQGAPLPPPTGGPPELGPNCVEVPNISNEVKDGLFDGGYAFETMCPGGWFDGCAEIPLTPGDYIVEVEPLPFYKIIENGDENTDEGNELIKLPPVGPNYSPSNPPPGDCIGGVGVGCNRRLVTVKVGRNSGADFFFLPDFTDFASLTGDPSNKDNTVMIPGRIFGFALDDLNVETDPERIYYGEKRGIPDTPIGLRDFTGRLVAMVNSDVNGLFEVLLPSGIAADCPTPAGICPNVYKVVVNDPGDPDNPTPNFNPNYQTLTFQFDVWPGKTTYADVATFPITAFAEFPGGQFNLPADCRLPADIPEIHYVNSPRREANDTLIISGTNFGHHSNPGTVSLGGTVIPHNIWNSGQVQITIPVGHPTGPQQLLVTSADGQTSPSGLTIHVYGAGYDPYTRWVDAAYDGSNGLSNGQFNRPYTLIQDAIDNHTDGTLIIVQPGVYYQDIVLNKSVKLQGYGPGAPDGFGSGGTMIDQRFNTIGVEVGAADPGDFDDAFNPQIDGFRIANVRGEQDLGGAIRVTVNGQNLEISNNALQSNGGNIGGGIIIGEPYIGDNNNDDIRIHHNRILNNGGIARAGGIGIYNGADNYEIDHNDICGNYSGEYGGGISHFGLSVGGSIHHNRIYRNNAFDEGGGIMVAGEQINVAPGDPTTTGSGDLDIYNNLIQENLSNDDGGGIRLLQPWDYHITIVNNMIVDNLSTDMGGGISLDDASDVEIVNNTIARNANTSTAVDSDKQPHSAGIAAEMYSDAFSTHLGLPLGTGFPDPVMFNNIICENQAYTYDFVNAELIAPPQIFDLEVFAGGGAQFDPRESLLTDTTGYDASNDLCGDMALLVEEPYELEINAVGFNQEPNFVTVNIVTLVLDGSLSGDYHLATGATAIDAGTDAYAGVNAPCEDFDDETRGLHDIGADEAPGGAGGSCSGGGSTYDVLVIPDLDVVAEALALAPGEVILNHSLHNTGDLADTYDLIAAIVSVDGLPPGAGWSVTVDPTVTAVMAPTDQTPVTATVTLPAGVISGTVATVAVTATSQGNPAVSSTVTDTITFFTVPLPPTADFYFSRDRNNPIGNLTGVRDEDILGYNGTTGEFSIVFDGSDMGLANNMDLQAFHFLGDGSILMSFNRPGTLPGVGAIDDSDIVRFIPTSLGDVTVGTFVMYLVGADVGLTANQEDIDAITFREGDQLLISTTGTATVFEDATSGAGPTVTARDEDILMYEMFDVDDPSLGGVFSLYLDGSDVGLSAASEDVNALAYSELEALHLSTRDAFDVGVVSGDKIDVFVCTATATGSNSACTYSPTLFFDGSAAGMAADDGIDGFDLP